MLLRICLPLTVVGCGRNAAGKGNETICVLSLIYLADLLIKEGIDLHNGALYQ